MHYQHTIHECCVMHVECKGTYHPKTRSFQIETTCNYTVVVPNITEIVGVRAAAKSCMF